MKIGILTFHRAHNYGAVLQAFALQEVIKQMGHTVHFIDYKNYKLLSFYKIILPYRFYKNKLTSFFHEIRLLPSRVIRYYGFSQFISRNLLLEKNCDFDFLNQMLDAVIIGSDQVWNFRLTYGFDPYYWGMFKKKDSKLKLISYAASMEISILTKLEESEISKRLDYFDSISVREISLKNILKDITKKEISVVADPTLLLNKELWEKIARYPRINEPYLLLYQVRNSPENEILAKKIAKQKGLSIIYLSAAIEDINSKISKGASPVDYLGLFKSASFVVCSSFHGTVFSVLFKIPFYSIIMKDGKDSRNISLLNYLGLMDRAISFDFNFLEEIIDWNKVEVKLNKLREHSLLYLKSSLL